MLENLLEARARQILTLANDTKNEICDDGQTGTINVGAIPTIAPFFLPDLLRQFAKHFPTANVILHEDTTERLIKECQQGDIDVAILALPISARHLDVEELFDEELLLVMPKGHPLDEKKQIRLADIEPYPFVLLDEAHCLTDNIISICQKRSFKPVSVERTSQLTTIQELVSLKHGISMIPAMARRLDTSKRRIYRSISHPKPSRTIALVSNPYRFQSRLLKAFQQLVANR